MSQPTVFIFDSGVKDDPIEFTVDVTSLLKTDMTASVTRFPVEGGGNISDHFQANPLTLNITGMISQSPSSMFATIMASLATGVALHNAPKGVSQGFAGALLSGLALAGNSGAFGGGADSLYGSPYTKLLDDENRSEVAANSYPKQAMVGLIKMFEAGKPFRIRTYFSEEIYNNMVITSLSFNQTATTGDSLPFSMVCQRVKTVAKFEGTTSEFTAVDPASSSATETVDKGTKVTKKVEAEENKSVAAKIEDWLKK